MGRRLRQAVIPAVLVSGCSFAQTSEQHADRILVNGKIWTEDESRPQAQALAVSGDKIIGVGEKIVDTRPVLGSLLSGENRMRFV